MVATRVLPGAARRPGRVETATALSLAARMPRLVLEARRVAASLAHGAHGRRRAGPGESFWQFRAFTAGEAASRIDWRRSGRDDRLYVREREWESPHAIWLWFDRSASMAYASALAGALKVERAFVVGLALAEAFVEGGERVGLHGHGRPRSTRRIVEEVAEALVRSADDLDQDLPEASAVPRRDEIVLIGDFLAPLPEIAGRIEAMAAKGARGHLLRIVDPVEETFPFEGQAVLHDLEAGLSLRVGEAGAWGTAYRERMRQHGEALAGLCRAHGWSLTIHHTDRPASEPATRLMSLVASARRGGG